jgi:hypothetical protein
MEIIDETYQNLVEHKDIPQRLKMKKWNKPGNHIINGI